MHMKIIGLVTTNSKSEWNIMTSKIPYLKATRPDIDYGAVADALTHKKLMRNVGVEEVRGELRDRARKNC